MPTDLMKLEAAVPTNLLLTQAQSSYDRYMQMGYDATRQRNYSVALAYFQQALQTKPGDQYAIIASHNIASYIARDRLSGGKRRRYFMYIPAFGQPDRLVPAGTRAEKPKEFVVGTLPSNVNNQTAVSVTQPGTAASLPEQKRQPPPSAVRGNYSREYNYSRERSRQVAGSDRISQACIQSDQSVTAIVPFMNTHQITTAAYPTLFFYIPHTDAQTYALIVQDENNQTIYRGNFNTPGNPGIVSISPPANSKVPELKVGKNYTCFLSDVCNRTHRIQDSDVKGSIQRIEPEKKLRMELAKADIKERAAIYAMSGFLPDALTTLAQLRRERPNDADLKTDWEDLLRSAGLEGISQAPLVQCCNL